MLIDIYLKLYMYLFFGVSALLCCAVLYIVHCGLFSRIEVKVRRPPFKQLKVAYKFTRGKVSKCRRILAETRNIDSNLNPFAIYHEEDEGSSDGMSYTVGALVEGFGPAADQSTYLKFAQLGYSFVRFPAVDYIIMATFPHVNQLSDIVGVARVYPHIKKFIKARRICAHPLIEIYTERETLFIVPLSKQDAFYVPEALPVYESTDSENEYRSARASRKTKSSVPKDVSWSPFEAKILNNMCYCDALLRSHSCDYCRRAL